jgi:hypothetical protein
MPNRSRLAIAPYPQSEIMVIGPHQHSNLLMIKAGYAGVARATAHIEQ